MYSPLDLLAMDQKEGTEQKRMSPPKAFVDSSPLQSAMEKNRESLKIKLMIRRSANQLVEQGILPPLKTSPVIHEQKKQLERAKTGDYLKAKIQQRPNRQELERRHILPHEHVDPSLAEKYRMLEKAILVDQLNSKISHRPGPLELIEKNILHANEPIERIVKEGLVPFKASSNDEEDSQQSSEGDVQHNIPMNNEPVVAVKSTNQVQQQQHQQQQHQHLTFETATDANAYEVNFNVINLSLPISCTTTSSPADCEEGETKVTIKIPSTSSEHGILYKEYEPLGKCIAKQIDNPIVTKQHIKTDIDAPFSGVNVPSENNLKQHISSFIQNNQKFSSSGRDRNRKKCKIKPSIKTRAIKFHEYKGPPNAQNNRNTFEMYANKKNGETNYELIMQQQCLLEYLEGIYKSTGNKNDIDTSHESKIGATSEGISEKYQDDVKQEEMKKPFITIFPLKPNATTIAEDTVITDVNGLGKMKVSELKAYLKKLNLPVSGPKPLLIERLKSYLPLKLSDHKNEKVEEKNEKLEAIKEALNFASATCSDVLNTNSHIEDDIVKEQQRKIEELQRRLQESQIELEQIKQNKGSETFLSTASQDYLLNKSIPLKKETFFQIIPNTNDITNNVLYDSKYQMSSPICVVVGVSSAPINSQDTTVNSTSLQKLASDHMEDCKNNNSIESSVDNTASSSYKENFSNTILQDDINDVLEILLENEKWNVAKNDEYSEDKSILKSSSINTQPDENVKEEIIFKDNLISPMDKIMKDPLETASIQPISPEFEKNKVIEQFNSDNFESFPMEVEENSIMNNSIVLENEKTTNQNSLYDNFCNTRFDNQPLFVNADAVYDSGNEIHKSCIKNSLIGNFDNNLFDTFKNNIMISNATTHPINNNAERKDVKNYDKSIFSTLNSFEVFGNNDESTPVPMEFENLPFEMVYPHDPFFNLTDFNSFNSFVDRENIAINTNFINHVNEISSDMFCDADNLSETEKV